MNLKNMLLACICVSALRAQITLPNAVPMPTPEIQYLDMNGAPLAGSKLCTYAAGTSTPLATYTDSTAGTPNTNPIILDSAGRASVWVAAKLYKFVLRTGGDGTCSTGSIVWTQDNVADTTLYFTNAVKTVGTASLITTTNTPTGSVSRTQLSKNNDILSVKDFGAVGDGSTDDTAAINLAMAQSTIGTSSTPGVCIFFPNGIYRITAALSYSHTICAIGSNWRLKYTAGGSIPAILSLIGDPVNAPLSHGTHMEGSVISNAILDGQGHAVYGLVLQGVISAQIDQMRVTNVTSAGVDCNWCQQVTFERLQVSADFEAFSTTPAYGIIIDNISSANILSQANIDHVSADGIWLKYALNTLVSGGTSEGNGGWGVRCDSSGGGGYQCFNNTFIQFDVEANTAGDYLFGSGSYFNSVFATNSSSLTGITFSGDAHFNVFHGGAIGVATASAGTYGNALLNVGSFSLVDPVWIDSGSNINTTIRNQSTGIIQQAANNYTIQSFQRQIASATRVIESYTPSPTYADFRVGAPAGATWVGFISQNGQSPEIVFNNASPGMCFLSETGYRTGGVPQGCIVAGNWGFGTFNSAPAYKFHFFDASVTTVAIQDAAGQGGADLLKILAVAGGQISGIDNLGTFNGATGAYGTAATVAGCGAGAVTGGSTGGTFTVTTTGTCTAVVTVGATAGAGTHGWNCSASATTGPLSCLPTTATTFTIKGTTTSGDTISFHATKY